MPRLRRYLAEWPTGVVLAVYWAVAYRTPSATRRPFHDTDVYFWGAQSGFFSPELWGGGRAPLSKCKSP
ncbi:MAG: hypothetical protein QM756_34180 [Polyangiaceae bacterium]